MSVTLDETRLEAFLGRAVTDLAAAESAVAAYLGDRLGLYTALADGRWHTAGSLAAATGNARATGPGVAAQPGRR